MPTNGGIIGPENIAGTTLTQDAKTTIFTSSGTFTAQPMSTAVTYVIVAGGGSALLFASKSLDKNRLEQSKKLFHQIHTLPKIYYKKLFISKQISRKPT